MGVEKKGRMLKADELAAYNLQMAMMLRAGILPAVAVETLREDSENKREIELLSSISGELDKGAAYYMALRSSGCFPAYMVNMVKIGEDSGRLDSVTEQLASHYDKEARLAESVRQAATYPCIMLLIMVAVVLVLMAEVLPIFEQVYSDLGVSLSPLAEVFLKIGSVSKLIMLVFTVLAFVAVAVAFFSVRAWGTGGNTSLAVGRIFGSGKFSQELSLSRFCSAVAMMLYSGMNYTDAAKEAKSLITSKKCAAQADKCVELLESGESLMGSVGKSGLITGLPASLLSAGIKSGAVDRAMSEAADRYAERADTRINKTVGRIEPSLVIILCVIVGLVLLSVMLPLAGIMTNIAA